MKAAPIVSRELSESESMAFFARHPGAVADLTVLPAWGRTYQDDVLGNVVMWIADGDGTLHMLQISDAVPGSGAADQWALENDKPAYTSPDPEPDYSMLLAVGVLVGALVIAAALPRGRA